MAMTVAQLEAKLNALEEKLTPPKTDAAFDWMKTIQLHPLVIAGGLLVSGATGAIGGYLALENFVEGRVAAALEKQKASFKGDTGPKGDQGPQGVRGLQGAKGEKGDDSTISAGMTVAFDVPAGCPSGWTVFERGISRTIIGANPPNWGGARNLDQNNNPLSIRGLRDVGGVETNAVGLEQLPNLTLHSEELKLVHLTDTGPAASTALVRTTAAVGPTSIETKLPGGGQPLNNMPPFVSLVYCEKD